MRRSRLRDAFRYFVARQKRQGKLVHCRGRHESEQQKRNALGGASMLAISEHVQIKAQTIGTALVATSQLIIDSQRLSVNLGCESGSAPVGNRAWNGIDFGCCAFGPV